MLNVTDDRPVFEEVWKPVLDLWTPKLVGMDKVRQLQWYLSFSPLVSETGELFLAEMKTAEEVVQALVEAEAVR